MTVSNERLAKLTPCPFCGSANIDPLGWASTESAGPACDECGASVGSVKQTPEQNVTAWNLRSSPSCGSGVKKLVWAKTWSGCSASSAVGTYSVKPRKTDDGYDVFLASGAVSIWNTWASSEERGIAAAQADFDQRIKSALEPAEGEAAAWQRKNPGLGWQPVNVEDIPHYRSAGQEIRPLFTRPASFEITAEMGERATMTLLEKDKDPAPGVNWICDRSWHVNDVRTLMRAALTAALNP